MKGGYFMINCEGLDLTKGTTPQTVKGLYNKILSAMTENKPIYCYNAVWGDYGKITPISCFANHSSTDDLIVTSSTLQIIVTKEDSITIENMVA